VRLSSLPQITRTAAVIAFVLVAMLVPLASKAMARASLMLGSGMFSAINTHTNDSFRAVSCTGVKGCVAVGYHQSTQDLAVAASWNGSYWAATPYPVPPVSQSSELYGVSCPAADFCVAVGKYATSKTGSYPLAERWDGKKWHFVAISNPKPAVASVLEAVSCTSASFCMAVGNETTKSDELAFTEMWNGFKWTVVAAPSPTPVTDLLSVSCTAKPSWCMAGGDDWAKTTYYSTLTEQWTGSKWGVVKSPSPAPGYGSYLYGISCTGPANCVAAGSWEQTTGNVNVIDRWHGKGWFQSSAVNPIGQEGQLKAVACANPSSCWSVGYESHLSKATAVTATEAEFWNGARWSLVPTPNGPKSNTSSLYGVSCPSSVTCVAVGAWVAPGTVQTSTLVDTWNGQKWTRSNSPNP